MCISEEEFCCRVGAVSGPTSRPGALSGPVAAVKTLKLLSEAVLRAQNNNIFAGCGMFMHMDELCCRAPALHRAPAVRQYA